MFGMAGGTTSGQNRTICCLLSQHKNKQAFIVVQSELLRLCNRIKQKET